MSVDRKVGVVGLGLMGTVITERLLESGYRVVVWNRTRDKAESLLKLGAVWSDNPLAECQRVIISLYNSDIVAEVIDQMRSGLHRGQTIVDTTTGEPTATMAMGRRLAELGVTYLDAPISGSSEQTRKGESTVMVGGKPDEFASCHDLWPVLGKKVFHVGECGSAAKMKLVTNLVLGLNRAVLAEGLVFAEAIGILPTAALEVLQGSPAYSKAMDIKGRKMIARDFTVQAKLSQHLKDIRLMLEAATATGLELTLARSHAELLERAERAGFGELDNSAVINAYLRPTP